MSREAVEDRVADPDPVFKISSDPVFKFDRIRTRFVFRGSDPDPVFSNSVPNPDQLFSRRSDPDPVFSQGLTRIRANSIRIRNPVK